MTESKRRLKVFLCHAHNDKDKVRNLYSRLKREGVDAWLDKENLLPGSDWDGVIRKAVHEADVIVVCLSKDFNQVGFRQKEVRIALEEADKQPEGEIFIIPARLEECENLESLRKWHWVDLFEDDGYQRLIRALRSRADRVGATLRIRKGGKSITYSQIQEDLEAEEQVRTLADKEEKQKIVREQVKRETAEKIAREKEELERARLIGEEHERQKVFKEKAERESAEKAEREVAEQTARDKSKELEERARLEAEKRFKEKNAKKQEDKEAMEKVRLEAGKQESFKIDDSYAKIKPWIAYGGAISIGLFFGILFILVIAIPAVVQINIFSLPPVLIFLIFLFILAGVWLVLTRRRLAFFLSYTICYLLTFLVAAIISYVNNESFSFEDVLSSYFILGFFVVFLAFFLLKISVTNKLFSKILFCCVACIVLLFIVILGNNTMPSIINMPLEVIYGFLPYIVVYFLFCSFFGNWLRRVLKNRLPNLFAEN